MPTPLMVEEFGKALVITGDLDPVYVMLEGAQLDRATLQRWCLAYWMFYHAGVASRLCVLEDAAFWDAVTTGLSGAGQFPRGTERRHFRGQAAVKSVQYLSRRFAAPEQAAYSLEGGDRLRPGEARQFTDVARSITEWTGFGPWIAFKVADMLDGVLGVPVDFTSAVPGGIFDDPIKGAVWAFTVEERAKQAQTGLTGWSAFTVAAERDGYPDPVMYLSDHHEGLSMKERQALTVRVMKGLLVRFKKAGLEVPTRPGTSLRIQEVETVLCKWKSHLNGHYPVGKDTTEILHGLRGWGSVADRLREVLMERATRAY